MPQYRPEMRRPLRDGPAHQGRGGRCEPFSSPDPKNAPFEPAPKCAGLCGIALRIRAGVGAAERFHPLFSWSDECSVKYAHFNSQGSMKRSFEYSIMLTGFQRSGSSRPPWLPHNRQSNDL